MSVASSTLKGAATGATTGATMGATIGSVIPGFGTVAGTVAGTIAGTAVGGINSYINAGKLEKQEANSQRELDYIKAQQDKLQVKSMESASRVKQQENYKNQYTTTLYADGSNGLPKANVNDINLKGNLQQVSSTGAKIIGDSHGEGGVPTIDENGNPIELEGDEFVDGEGDNKRVFSNSLISTDGISFAKKAEKLSEEKAALEDKLIKSNDQYMQDTIDRQIEIVETRLARTFHEQGAASINN